jgi:hypothetical protein
VQIKTFVTLDPLQPGFDSRLHIIPLLAWIGQWVFAHGGVDLALKEACVEPWGVLSQLHLWPFIRNESPALGVLSQPIKLRWRALSLDLSHLDDRAKAFMSLAQRLNLTQRASMTLGQRIDLSMKRYVLSLQPFYLAPCARGMTDYWKGGVLFA